MKLSLLILLALLLAACEGISQTGVRTTSHQDMDGGELNVRINKANGSAVQDIEVEEGWPGLVMEVDIALSVGQGCFKIEPLGEDDQVTLVLEACDGQAVSGHGQMMVDAFGEASYRATAAEAEDVEYKIEYTFK